MWIQCAAIIQFLCNACFMCLELWLVLQLKTVVKFHSWNYLCFYCWFYNSSTLSPVSPQNRIHTQKLRQLYHLKKRKKARVVLLPFSWGIRVSFFIHLGFQFTTDYYKCIYKLILIDSAQRLHKYWSIGPVFQTNNLEIPSQLGDFPTLDNVNPQ